LTIVPVPFLCGYFLLRGSSGFTRPALAAGLALSVWVGLASGSNAVQVAWISGLGLLVITAALLRLQRVMLRRAGPTLSQTLTTWNLLTLGVLSLVALSAIPLGQNLIDGVRSGDEGGIREFLWKNAWRALWNSPLVGVGPGQPELGDRNQQIISEAHNLFLDIGLASGFLGLGALIVMLLVVLFRSQLLEQPVLLAAFVSLLGFSLFHHTARHPLFWFYLILISSVAYTRRRSRDAGAPVMTLESGRRAQTEKLRSPAGRGVAQLDRMRS
jgi:O-Antigen ligase